MKALMNVRARTFTTLTGAAKEIVRINCRDGIQHGSNLQAVNFMNMPFSELRNEVGVALTAAENTGDPFLSLCDALQAKFNIKEFSHPVVSYKNFSPDNLLKKESLRESILLSKMVAVVGSSKVPSSADAASAQALGKEMALHNIVVVCHSTKGILEPFLQSFRKYGGLAVGIVAQTNVSSSNKEINENSGLINLPIVTDYADGILRKMVTAMSGRAIVALNGRDESSLRSLMISSYNGTPMIVTGVKLPEVAQHPLQSTFELEETERVMGELFKYVPEDTDENSISMYKALSERLYTPVSVLAGTKFDENSVDENFAETLGSLLHQNGLYPITGSGPGPMMVVARGAQKAPNVGINFFTTYLAANRFINIAVVSSLNFGKSDFHALSSVATVNLGGSHTTLDELLSARKAGKLIINCLPEQFPTEFLETIHGTTTSIPIKDARSPEQAIKELLNNK